MTTEVINEPVIPNAGDKAKLAEGAKLGASSMGEKFRQATAEEIQKRQEPAKEPEPAPEAKTVEKPKPVAEKPSVATDAAKSGDKDTNFANLRKKAEAAEKRVSDLEAQLTVLGEESKAYKEAQGKLEQAQKRLSELELYEAKYAIETSPEFVKHYDARIQAAIEDAKSSVSPDTAKRLEEVLKAPPDAWQDKQVKEIAADLDEFDRMQLATAFNTIKQTRRERQQELEGERLKFNVNKLQELQDQKKRESEAKIAHMRESFWKVVDPEVDGELSKVDDKEYVTKAKQSMRKLLDGKLDAEEYKQLLVNTAKGYRASKTEQALVEELESLREQVKKLGVSNPAMRLSSSPSAVNPQPTAKTMADKFREATGRS